MVIRCEDITTTEDTTATLPSQTQPTQKLVTSSPLAGRIWAQPYFLVEAAAAAKIWEDGVFPWLWNLLTLSSAGKVSRVRWVWHLFYRTKDFTMFFTMCHFKLRHRKRQSFISERDVRQNDFRTPRWLSIVFFYFKIKIWCWDFNQV